MIFRVKMANLQNLLPFYKPFVTANII